MNRGRGRGGVRGDKRRKEGNSGIIKDLGEGDGFDEYILNIHVMAEE